jgi:hypothetical protein
MVNMGLTEMIVEAGVLYPEHGGRMCHETFISIHKIARCNDREYYDQNALVMTCQTTLLHTPDDQSTNMFLLASSKLLSAVTLANVT